MRQRDKPAPARRAALRIMAGGVATMALMTPLSAPARPKMDPSRRIADAMNEVRDALQELHPDWRIHVAQDRLGPLCAVTGQRMDALRHAVMIVASSEPMGREEIGLAVHYPDLSTKKRDDA
ncbi:hypothetical protein [Notoacmeibacter sp. MSK16QG-6]|uniref:hypothetical protein n=1 Tax=Notoacmeibacter sp. MSK16QG-6 TaxID=2957982 RepID=UPI00209D2D66|nr:hypothetical protein [Notoacmeibacter sp. MSK16QG-6]MCP1200039.1 hypothetical protein [Notoacmeibacter sp. MSK16QG-6]